MKNKIKSIFNQRNTDIFLYSLIILVGLVYSLNAVTGYRDDSIFLDFFKSYKNDLLGFILIRYETWTSRVIIESILIFITNSKLLWIILNTFSFVIIFYAIINLTSMNNDLRAKLFIIGNIVLYPYFHMHSAGWITTTVNYTWVLAFGLIALLPIKKIMFEEKIKWYDYIIFSFSILYSSNTEQMNIILLIIYFVFISFFIFKKVSCKFLVIQFILILFNFSLIIFSPGNQLRKILEVGRWFPEYTNIKFFRLIEMGFSSAFFEFIFKFNSIFLVFSFLLFYLVYNHSSRKFTKYFSAIPLIVQLIFGAFYEPLRLSFPVIEHISKSMTQFGTGLSIHSFISWAPNLIILLVILSIILSLLYGLSNINKSIFIIFILMVGFLSRFMLAFSPTIWASVERTYLYMYFTIVLSSIYLFIEIKRNSNNTKINYYIFDIIFYGLVVLSFVNNIYLIVFA